MASGGHGYGGGAGGNNHHAATGGAGAWDSLNYLDVLKEVYSSLSFPGIVPDAGMAPGSGSRDGHGQGGPDQHALAAGSAVYPPQYLHDSSSSNMGPPPPAAHAAAAASAQPGGNVGDEDSCYAAMDEDGPPVSQQRQAYRDRKRRVGAAAGARGGARGGGNGGESSGSDAGQLPEGPAEEDDEASEGDGQDTPRSGKGKGLFLPPRHPSGGRRGAASSSRSRRAAASPAPSDASAPAASGGRSRRRAALKAEAMLLEQAGGGGRGAGEGDDEEEDDDDRSGFGESGNEEEGEEEEEEAIDEALMNLILPAQFETDFVGAVFRLGLKCSSPKVLMDHMPRTETLTTEHIKSHLQKYRLHSNRSKDEFIEYFNGYLRGPFASFCARRAWEQRGDGSAHDAAAFAAIPHHASYMAPGDRQHHMRQVQALTGQLLQGQLELQAQVQNYITSQIAIQGELLNDVVKSSLLSFQQPPQQPPPLEQPHPLILDGDLVPPHGSFDGQGLSALAEEARALDDMEEEDEEEEPSPPKSGKRRPASSGGSNRQHHHGRKAGAAAGAITARLGRGVTAV